MLVQVTGHAEEARPFPLRKSLFVQKKRLCDRPQPDATGLKYQPLPSATTICPRTRLGIAHEVEWTTAAWVLICAHSCEGAEGRPRFSEDNFSNGRILCHCNFWPNGPADGDTRNC